MAVLRRSRLGVAVHELLADVGAGGKGINTFGFGFIVFHGSFCPSGYGGLFLLRESWELGKEGRRERGFGVGGFGWKK